MKITDFLSQSNVVTDITASQKGDLLQMLAQIAASSTALPIGQILSELVRREDLGSTGIGGGIAIPHARVQGVMRPLGILVKLRQPIDFDAVDNRPVDLVFFLLLPANSQGDQLGALACMARALRDPEILAQLRRAKNASELYRAIAV